MTEFHLKLEYQGKMYGFGSWYSDTSFGDKDVVKNEKYEMEIDGRFSIVDFKSGIGNINQLINAINYPTKPFELGRGKARINNCFGENLHLVDLLKAMMLTEGVNKSESEIKKPASDAPYGDGARNEETAEIRPGDQNAVKKEYEDHGWVGWKGGACPVDSTALVDVIFRNGSNNAMREAHSLRWSNHGDRSDIVEYRLARTKVWQDKQPDKDGWIPHVPGPIRPVHGEVMVQVRLRGGHTSLRFKRADMWAWTEAGECTIVAYRLTNPRREENIKERDELSAKISRLNAALEDLAVAENNADFYKTAHEAQKSLVRKAHQERDAWREKAEAAGKTGTLIAELSNKTIDERDSLKAEREEYREAMGCKNEQIALMAEGFAAFKAEADSVVRALMENKEPLLLYGNPITIKIIKFLKKCGGDNA